MLIGLILTLVSATPSTLSFSSSNNLTSSSALDLPTLSGPSKKKLFPASSGVAISASKIVKCPIPGNTRFLRIEVEVAVVDSDDADTDVEDAVVDDADADADAELVGRVMDVMEKDGME